MKSPIHAAHATPLGPMWSTWTDAGLHRLSWTEPTGPITPSREMDDALTDFFAGNPSALASMPLDGSGWTEFTSRVYEACRQIPFGETVSYQQLAAAVDRPGASRAVGGAMSRNRLLLIIPCHRVIAANGKLTGFSAPGGLRTKQRLLDLERAVAANLSPARSTDRLGHAV